MFRSTRPCGCVYRIQGQNTKPVKLCRQHSELYANAEHKKRLAAAEKALHDRHREG